MYTSPFSHLRIVIFDSKLYKRCRTPVCIFPFQKYVFFYYIFGSKKYGTLHTSWIFVLDILVLFWEAVDSIRREADKHDADFMRSGLESIWRRQKRNAVKELVILKYLRLVVAGVCQTKPKDAGWEKSEKGEVTPVVQKLVVLSCARFIFEGLGKLYDAEWKVVVSTFCALRKLLPWSIRP